MIIDKKYFVIVQPDNFNSPTKIVDIIIQDMEYNNVYHNESLEFLKDFLFNLCERNTIFITYNGYLLEEMLDMFFGISDYKNIINLMEDFARIKGDYNEYFESYTWSKLEDALNFYKNKGIDIHFGIVDINSARIVIYCTHYLYDAIQEYEEIEIQEEIKKGVI